MILEQQQHLFAPNHRVGSYGSLGREYLCNAYGDFARFLVQEQFKENVSHLPDAILSVTRRGSFLAPVYTRCRLASPTFSSRLWNVNPNRGTDQHLLHPSPSNRRLYHKRWRDGKPSMYHCTYVVPATVEHWGTAKPAIFAIWSEEWTRR